MNTFALALKKYDIEAPEAAAFLAAAGGYEKDSAREFVRRQPGFLGRDLTLEEAKTLKEAAQAAGLETALFSEDDIKAPPVPLKVLKIDPKGSGFYVTAGGAVTFVKYEDISVLAAAAYDKPAAPLSAEDLKPGVFDGILRLAGLETYRPVTKLPPKETFFRADIIAENGALRLLLEPENLDFSPLGPARSHTSLINFRALLDTLSAPAFHAARNAFLQAFLAGRALTPLKVSGPQAADTDLSRLLLLTTKRPE